MAARAGSIFGALALMPDPIRTRRTAPSYRIDLAALASRAASELRRRADGPGLEGMVADQVLRLLHESARRMGECAEQLERAITPAQAPRARRAPARRRPAKPARVHKLHPDE